MENDLVNQQLGKYIIQGEIGRGGMGAVYLAFDPDLERQVAIKVLFPHLTWEKEFVERFLREAKAAAKLKHPHIVTIYDVGQHENWYYFVMEHLEGVSLSALIRERESLSLEQTMSILRPLADALEHAHQRGLIHRDIKPGNVIVGPSGGVTLTDFGIARVAEQARLTASGAIIGTPAYMSPEQANGLPADERSDQYSLAVVAYEMLSGIAPFEATSLPAVLHKIVYETPPPISKTRSDLPPGLDMIIGKALAKQKRERYSTVQAFADELDTITTKQAMPAIAKRSPPPIAPPPRPASTRSKTFPVKRPLWIALGMIAVLCLAILSALSLNVVLDDEKADVPSTSTTKPQAVETGWQPVSTVPATRVETDEPPVSMPEPMTNPRIVFYAQRDDNSDVYVMNMDGTHQKKLTHSAGHDEFPSVSPDGQQIAFQSDRDGNWEIYTMNLDGSNQRRLTSVASDDRLPTWSPDGQHILFVSTRDGNYEFYVMTSDGGNLRRLTHNERRDGHASWSPDGQITFNAGDAADSSTWEIYVMNADGSNERQLTYNNVNDWSPNWTPDGRILFLSRRENDDPALWLMQADGADPQELYNTSGAYDWGAVWSPNNRYVAFTSNTSGQDEIYLLEINGGQVTQLTNQGAMYPGWAP